MLDKELRREIAHVVNEAAREAYLIYNEEWISAKELCTQFQMIPKSWLKTNKHLLPQGTLRYRDKDGNLKETHPAFPKHRINQMILDGELDFTEGCEYRPSSRRGKKWKSSVARDTESKEE